MKSIVAVAGVGAVMVGGTFLYDGAGGSFVEAANASKELDYVVQIADRLLELDEHPRVIAQDPIGVYLRQYSGQIDTLFGRDIQGHILWPRNDMRNVHNAVSTGEWELVNQYMLDDEIDYLVTSGDTENSSLMLVDTIADYGIYKASGKPQVIKVRNTLGQIMAETTVDTEGQPIIIDGHTTKEYEYDDNDNTITIHRNVDNARCFDSAIGNDYMEYGVRAAYHNMNLVYEAYYDNEGNLEVQPAGHVAIEQKWDDEQLISRTYLNERCQPVNRVDGYAKALLKPNEYEALKMWLYNTDGDEIDTNGINLIRDIDVGEDGWSHWYTPNYLADNDIMKVGGFNYTYDEIGDTYVIHMEIEFKNVSRQDGKHFTFATAGKVDDKWEGWEQANLWNYSYVWLNDVPTDRIYAFDTTVSVCEKMLRPSNCDIGFRFDKWESGTFRHSHSGF